MAFVDLLKFIKMTPQLHCIKAEQNDFRKGLTVFLIEFLIISTSNRSLQRNASKLIH